MENTTPIQHIHTLPQDVIKPNWKKKKKKVREEEEEEEIYKPKRKREMGENKKEAT